MQQMERDQMTGEKASPQDVAKEGHVLPQNGRIDDENSVQPVPPFLNEGPELVRDSRC